MKAPARARATHPSLSPPVTSGDRKPQVKCDLSPVTGVTPNYTLMRGKGLSPYIYLFLSDISDMVTSGGFPRLFCHRLSLAGVSR